jgi:hypothetical protein
MSEQQPNIEILDQQSFEDQRSSRAIELFHSTKDEFVAYIIDQDIEAHIAWAQGDGPLSYRLYSTSYGDGEVYYSNTPVTLLVTNTGEVSFQCETEPSGHYAGKDTSSPVPFEIATNLQEYKERPLESQLSYRERGLYYTDSTMIIWTSYMLYYMERGKEIRADPERIGTLDFHRDGRIQSIQNHLEKVYFPDGPYYYVYRQLQLAKQAIDRSSP